MTEKAHTMIQSMLFFIGQTSSRFTFDHLLWTTHAGSTITLHAICTVGRLSNFSAALRSIVNIYRKRVYGAALPTF